MARRIVLLAAFFVLINLPNTFCAEQNLIDLNAKGKEALGAQLYEVAIDCYSQALQIDPNSEEALFNRGLSYYNLKKAKDARADFLALNKLRPDADGVLFFIGLTYFQTRDYAKARSYFDEAYELEKKPLYLLNIASAFFLERKYHAVAPICKRALGLNPDDYMKQKIESLVSRSEQAIKEGLQKKARDQDWVRLRAEREADAREEARRQAERVHYTRGGTTSSGSQTQSWGVKPASGGKSTSGIQR